MKDYKLIKIPLFHQAISVFLTREVLEKRVKIPDFHPDGYAAQVVPVEVNGVDYIVMSFLDLESLTPEVIAHESMHAAWRVMDYAGIPVSKDTEEVAAYLTGYITDEVTAYAYKYLQSLIKVE